MKKLIILGSSRKDGNTKKVAGKLNQFLNADIIDLNDFKISYYDYGHENKNDDYMPLMRSIATHYDTLIFATPVYWYAMSGIMKVFVDRITDLLDNEKELGRALRNKNMAVVTSSTGDNLGDQFWHPFIGTAKYLGMHYIGGLHTVENKDASSSLSEFARLLNNEL